MRYVILRDDDTNALTPVECLERLYRPFLERNFPVNLAVIPDVATNALTPDGKPEGFLFAGNRMHSTASVSLCSPKGGEGGGEEVFRAQGENSPEKYSHTEPLNQTRPTTSPPFPIGWERAGVRARSTFDVPGPHASTVPIGENPELINYLLENPFYHVVQHGCHHDCFEFNRQSPVEISTRLEHGRKLLADAGLGRPVAFVAPHDKLSRTSYREVAKRFEVISSGWFELERLPLAWWPNYFVKKTRHAPHWRAGRTLLLSHPGCLLSAKRDFGSMLDNIISTVSQSKVTVLVTHWWEYFPDGEPHENFIRVLHQTADYLASQKDLKVISFAELAKSGLKLN